MATTKIDQVLFDMRTTPASARIGFTTQADDRAAKVGGVLRVEDATSLIPAGLIDTITKAVTEAASGVSEPGAVAARIQAAQEAQDAAKAARAAQREAEAKTKALDAQIAAKTAELNELEASIETKGGKPVPVLPVKIDPTNPLKNL